MTGAQPEIINSAPAPQPLIMLRRLRSRRSVMLSSCPRSSFITQEPCPIMFNSGNYPPLETLPHQFLFSIWTPPDSRGISYQTSDAYVYSAFQWRRYLPALNVCAPRRLYGSMDSMASKENRFHRGGYLLSDRGLSLNSSILAAGQAANG